MMPCSASSNVYTGTINSIQCDLNWPSKLCKPQFPLNALRINGQKILRGNDLRVILSTSISATTYITLCYMLLECVVCVQNHMHHDSHSLFFEEHGHTPKQHSYQ